MNTDFWWGNLREKYHSEYLDVDEKNMLKWIYMKLDAGMDSSGSGYRQVASSWERGDEPSGSIKRETFLE